MPPSALTGFAPPHNVGSVVEMTGLAWLVVTALAVAGPPALPPLPGERPPEPEPTAPAKPQPAKPAPRPTAKPAPAEPVSPTAPAPSASPTPPPPSTTPPPPSPGAPDIVEPPQPSASAGPPPGDPSPESSKDGNAPPMELESPDGAFGPDEEDERPMMPRLPPPPRPRYRGTGLFIGAGVTFAVALAEQIVAHVLVKRQCIDPIAANAMMDSDPVVIDPDNPPDELPGNPTDELGEIVTQCAPGVVPALALRVHSDLGLLATIGMSAAGGALRGRQQAWDGVFEGTPHADYVGLRAAGIGLIAGGIVTWFSTSAASWAWLTSCDNGRCATRARLMNFTTRDASALMVAAGAGMLAFSETHRRASMQFERDRIFSIGVSRLPGGLMLGVHGRL